MTTRTYYTRDRNRILVVYFLFYYALLIGFFIDGRLLSQYHPIFFNFNRDLTELARRIHAREISPVEATTAQLARIEKLDDQLKSYAYVMAEAALVRAGYTYQTATDWHRKHPT